MCLLVELIFIIETTVGTNEQEPANIQEQMSIINNQTMITIEEIIEATNNDKTLSAIIENIREGHKFLPIKNSSLNGYRQIPAFFPNLIRKLNRTFGGLQESIKNSDRNQSGIREGII